MLICIIEFSGETNAEAAAATGTNMFDLEGLNLAVEPGVNITDFTLCFRIYEHVYRNEILK